MSVIFLYTRVFVNLLVYRQDFYSYDLIWKKHGEHKLINCIQETNIYKKNKIFFLLIHIECFSMRIRNTLIQFFSVFYKSVFTLIYYFSRQQK